MYDQYDFESQNFDHENRRLVARGVGLEDVTPHHQVDPPHHGASPALSVVVSADTAKDAQGHGNVHSDPQNKIKEEAEFVARAPDDTNLSYFFLNLENQWAKLKKPSGNVSGPTYEWVDEPPADFIILYQPSKTSLEEFKSQDQSASQDRDIAEHARFTAWSGTDRYFYSLVEDQWRWWMELKQDGVIYYVPTPQLPPHYRITYVHQQGVPLTQAEHEAMIAAVVKRNRAKTAPNQATETTVDASGSDGSNGVTLISAPVVTEH